MTVFYISLILFLPIIFLVKKDDIKTIICNPQSLHISTLNSDDQWRLYAGETFMTTSICDTIKDRNDADGFVWSNKMNIEIISRLKYMPEATGIGIQYKEVALKMLDTTMNVNCSCEISKLSMREILVKMQKNYARIIKPLPPPLNWENIKICMAVYFETDFSQLLDPGQLTQQPNGWVGIISGIMRPQGWVEIWDGRSVGRVAGATERRHGPMNIFRMPGHFIATHMGGPAKFDDAKHLPPPPNELRRVCPNLSHQNGYLIIN